MPDRVNELVANKVALLTVEVAFAEIRTCVGEIISVIVDPDGIALLPEIT